jgi:hypothetical protein
MDKIKTTNNNFALVLIIAFTGKQSVHVFVYTTIRHNKQIKGSILDDLCI